jgi:hypothetical protein
MAERFPSVAAANDIRFKNRAVPAVNCTQLFGVNRL